MASRLTYRPPQSAQRAQLHEVYVASVGSLAPDVYTHEQVAAWVEGSTPGSFQMPLDQLCVALLETTVLGFSWLCPSGWLRALYVRPAWFRRGVGSALLERCESSARSRLTRQPERPWESIRVLASLNAVPFYARHGFGVVGNTQLGVARHCWVEVMSMQKPLTAPKALWH